MDAVGVALGLFPLLIEGIKFYISSAEKFKEMKHHKSTLDKFRRELMMEKNKFDNIWYTLVNKVGVLIEPNMEFSKEVMDEVLSGLPPYAIESFVNGFQELAAILRQLMERFEKHEQTRVGYLKMFGILRHFTKEDREQYIERIHRLNFNLDKLVNGAPQIAAANKFRNVNVAPHYQRVRKHAIVLYDALKENLSRCHCKIPHSANLQLGICNLGTDNSHHNHVPKLGRLTLLFPVLAVQSKTEEYLTLQELEFENLENLETVRSASDEKTLEYQIEELRLELPGRSLQYTTGKPQFSAAYTTSEQKTEPAVKLRNWSLLKRKRKERNLYQKKVENCLSVAETCAKGSPVPSASEKIIECFCSAIKNIAEMRTCIGILVCSNSKHQVWAPRAPLPLLTSARAISLAELLSLSEPPKRERLKLGVRLASSVLQFHKTEWLQERWGKKDIYLIQGDSSQSNSPSLEIPVVCQAFTPEPSVSEASMESHIINCNMSLFSLGIVLIELWFWKSVEFFQADGPQAHCSLADLDTARCITAKSLMKKLYGDAGDNYGNIIRRCIFGLDYKETQLENDGFKNKVYLKVLQPLEKHLEFFCDEPLGKIFGEGGS